MSTMPTKRVIVLVVASVLTALTFVFITLSIALQRDLVRDDISQAIGLGTVLAWGIWYVGGVRDKIDARLDMMEHRIAEYGDERATEGRLGAMREIGGVTEPPTRRGEDTPTHLRIAER